MKELNIKEKAQRYDEAIEKLRSLHDDYDTVSTLIDIKEELENIFPELKESEDEKIRKALIFHYQGDGCICTNEYRLDFKDIRAWLEKQGEHANFINKIQIGDKVTRNEDGVLVNLSQLNRIAKKDGQNPIDKYKEWYDFIRWFVKQRTDDYNFIPSLDDIHRWGDNILNHAIKVLEQNTAWSEEDETYSDHIITAIKSYYTDDKGKENPWREELLRWLKSLKDRYNWKPRDEHYELEEFAKIVRSNLTGISNAVQELFEAKYLQLTGNKMYKAFKD